MSERDRDLIRDAIMFAVKDISGRVLREAAVQSMIDDFIKELNQNKDKLILKKESKLSSNNRKKILEIINQNKDDE